ncbi:MAG: dicarboxylate/amino acid:cation symporter [Planctomycetaceae bacterium]
MTESSDRKSGGHLTLWIIVAIVLAISVSIFVPIIGLSGFEKGTDEFTTREETLKGIFEAISFGGEIFLRVLKMLVVPLVVLSVMSGVLGMGDVRKLGRPGFVAITFYLATTVLAVFLGLAMVNLLKPGGADIDRAQAEAIVQNEANAEKIKENRETVEQGGALGIVKNLGLMIFTDNLFNSAAKSDLLPLIVFSLVFAGLLTTLGERVEIITKVIDQANHAMMAFVMLVMAFAPLGIFCLVAGRFGKEMLDDTFVQTMKLVWWYSVTVVGGLAIHSLVTLPLILWVITRRNPYRFIVQMGQSLLTAFSTASSSATLPVTMECAVDRAGVSRKSVDFVLPLGATINMDGTALYEAVAAIFIAQFLGRDLSLAQQMVVAVTATLAAIGAAGIPEAGLVTMLIVLNAVGLPLEYQALILPVDWLLDRFRTTVNVFGDACGAAIVDRSFPAAEIASTT